MKNVLEQAGKLNAKQAGKLYIDTEGKIKQMQADLKTLDGDLTNLSLEDNKLIAHKQCVDLVHMKVDVLEKQKQHLEDIILRKLRQEAQNRLPKIEVEILNIDESKEALTKKMLSSSVRAEILDAYLNAYPRRVHRDLSPELRDWCENEKIRISKELGFDRRSSLIAHRQQLVIEKQMITSQDNYSDNFSSLIEKLSNDNG